MVDKERLNQDIEWFRGMVSTWRIYSSSWIGVKNFEGILYSIEMKNIVQSYGKDKLYKEDLENILTIAEMLI